MLRPNFSISSPSLKITEQNGLGRMPTWAMRMPRKFFTMQLTETKRAKEEANVSLSTAHVSMKLKGI